MIYCVETLGSKGLFKAHLKLFKLQSYAMKHLVFHNYAPAMYWSVMCIICGNTWLQSILYYSIVFHVQVKYESSQHQLNMHSALTLAMLRTAKKKIKSKLFFLTFCWVFGKSLTFKEGPQSWTNLILFLFTLCNCTCIVHDMDFEWCIFIWRKVIIEIVVGGDTYWC